MGKTMWRTEQAVSYTHLSAASLPSENSDAGAREWKRYREGSKKLGEVVRKEGKQGAMAFLKQIQDSREFQQDQMIQLKICLLYTSRCV